MNHNWIPPRDPNGVAQDVRVPEITDARLTELLSRFTPLYRAAAHEPVQRIVTVDPRKFAFTWADRLPDEVEFEFVGHSSTDHLCGYHAFFKPSVAEVLAQLPEEFEPSRGSGVNAFYIDMDEPLGIYSSGSGHRAKTIWGIIR